MGLFSRAPSTPLDGVDAVLADLDGVVYAGPGALPHAIESLNRAGRPAGSGTSPTTRPGATRWSPTICGNSA